jgi:hypothetical protein
MTSTNIWRKKDLDSKERRRKKDKESKERRMREGLTCIESNRRRRGLSKRNMREKMQKG